LQTPTRKLVHVRGTQTPDEFRSFQSAALSVYALKDTAAAEQEDTGHARLGREMARKESACNHQDRAFICWGSLVERQSQTIASATKALSATQRADGGWSQLANMGSDAYATGEALYALHIGGNMAVNVPLSEGLEVFFSTRRRRMARVTCLPLHLEP